MADITSHLPAVDQADGTAGSAAPTTAIQIGGSDGTNLRVPLVTAAGQTAITPTDGYKATYSAGVSGLTVAALATDIFTIAGSGTKTIRITRISVSLTTTAGSGATTNMSILKRSAANSGGTSAASTNVPHDSNSAAATATATSYTANATSLGALVGIVRSIRYALSASNITITQEWLFGTRPSQSIVLRGTSQLLTINLNATTITGAVADIDVEWTEE